MSRVSDISILHSNKLSNVHDLSNEELSILAAEIRELQIKKFKSKNGHVGSNLGAIEITIAMHKVFDIQKDNCKDKIVFDVSHMSYTHKILTGRLKGFENFGEKGGFTGYSDPDESKNDLFWIGHTGVSVGLGTGLAMARDYNNENYNVISFIGDGALSEGSSFESLNFASTLKTNFIIIINDNQMSINENVGGLYTHLQYLRENPNTSNNIFRLLGFEYLYENQGNNVCRLVDTLESAKHITNTTNKPIIVHINTQKGKGFDPAEKNQAKWHYGVKSPTWNHQFKLGEESNVNFPIVTSYYLDKLLSQDSKTVVLEPATPFMLQYLRYKYSNRFIDTGISEQTTVDIAAGLAKSGIKPYVILDPGFSQRAYDQIQQEVCMQNLPVTFVICGGTIDYGDKSHTSISDIAMFGSLPNMQYLAPTSYYELNQMLEFCHQEKSPTAVRLGGKYFNQPDRITPEIIAGQSEVVQEGEGIAIFGVGRFLNKAFEVSSLLQNRPTIINPRFVSCVDEDLLSRLLLTHHTFVTIEDGVRENGFGTKVAQSLSNNNSVKVFNFGADKEFLHYIPYDKLMEKYNLNAEQIAKLVQ